MTTRPKAKRFRLRLNDGAPAGGLTPGVAPQPARSATARDAGAPRPAAQAGSPLRPQTPEVDTTGLFDESAEPTAAAPAGPPVSPSRPAPQPLAEPGHEHGADVGGNPRTMDEIESIRAENLSGRQLRMAMRVAQRNGIRATTGLDAVRLLRKQGIDPFERATLVEIARDEGESGRALVATTDEQQPQLPKAYRQPATPAPATPPSGPAAERTAQISRIQQQIVQRRRRRMVLLTSRLLVFVGLPTLIAAWYFYMIATPLYATYSEFTIQAAHSTPTSGGGLAGALGGSPLGGFQESNSVQAYLQSRDAMRRLDTEEGFTTYFQSELIDPLRRLDPDTTNEAAFRLYQDVVLVSFDPTEGIIRMEVIAADPETSERFARALVAYAEEQVDQLTQRQRENQLRDSMASLTSAEERFAQAQMNVLELQERYQILSSEVEVSLLTQQITNLETQLSRERLDLADLQANSRPNAARLEQVRRRIESIEGQITALRSQLTDDNAEGVSLARVQRELVMAQSDVATRQMMLAQAMQQLEGSRMEANRQVRFLALSVVPIAPDEPTYPRSFENTALALIIFSGLYLMISMTTAILREQVTG